MGEPINILIVDDSPDDAFLVVRKLKSVGFDPAWQRVETEMDFRAALTGRWDIILSDIKLPRFSGQHALEILKAAHVNIPFIVVSGSDPEESRFDNLLREATGVVPKHRLGLLDAVVRKALQDLRSRPGKILVVQEDPGKRAETRGLLENAGYKVVDAADAQGALNTWAGHPERIDLLITDVSLPDGVTGFDVAGRLRFCQSGLNVIFLNGLDSSSHPRESELPPGQTLLKRPWAEQTMLQAVRKSLGKA